MISNEFEREMPFFGGVIHQFRNWMGGIIGHSDLALSSNDPEDMKEGLNIALELSEKSTELLTALSKFRNEKPGTIRPGNLAEIGRQVRILTDNWLKENGIDVSEELKPAFAEKMDPALVRITLLDDIRQVIDLIARGTTIEYISGFSDNLPYVGFKTQIDNAGINREKPLTDSIDSYLRREVELGESGDYHLKLVLR